MWRVIRTALKGFKLEGFAGRVTHSMGMSAWLGSQAESSLCRVQVQQDDVDLLRSFTWHSYGAVRLLSYAACFSGLCFYGVPQSSSA